MLSSLAGKKIIVGVTGSIAAYKACNLVRSLRKQGAEVLVAMTAAAQQFVNKRTFEVLSSNKVFTDIFSDESDLNHVEWARGADAFLVVPATANTLAKLANGFAEDPVSTLFLSSQCPVLLCPAMHTAMWENQAVQKNLAQLKTFGVHILGPASGDLSMGDYGEGRLIDEQIILNYLASLLMENNLIGRKILLTVGPTYEPIDRVRFISNRSSGKMGQSLVHELYLRGAQLKVISALPRKKFLSPWDDRLELIEVSTAQEMLQAVAAHFDGVDTFVSVAAVADFRPESFYDGKLEKNQLNGLNLVKNDDILATMAARRAGQKLVGFVLQDACDNNKVLEKIAQKGLDICIAVTDQALGEDEIRGDLFIGSQKQQSFQWSKVLLASALAKII